MGDTLDYINSMRCAFCQGCDEPESCEESEFFTEDDE